MFLTVIFARVAFDRWSAPVRLDGTDAVSWRMPATDWKEVIGDDEPARFERYAAILAAIQRKHAGKAPARALHAKGNLGALAELEVLADIATDGKQGMFATPAKHQALVRYSNGSPRDQADRKPDVRGIAVKVLGVPGTKVIPGMENATTQDFLAIRTPSTPVRNAAEFIALVRAAQTPALLPLRLIGSLGFGRALAVIKGALAGFKVPTAPLAATTYYSALPIAFGPYAAQYVFRPHDALSVTTSDSLGDELAARLRTASVVYDVCVKFYVDAKTTPIEDASVAWPGELVPVARLTLPQQDPTSPRGLQIAAVIDKLAFDPWHARTDHRPLGDMMRARNVAYRASTQAREAAPEPTELPRFD